MQLQDSHLRFTALESELNKLKPLLLMQPPSPYINSFSQEQFTSQASHSVDPGSSKSKLGRKTGDSTHIEELEQNELSATPTKNISRSQSNTDLSRSQARSDHYGRRSRMSVLSPLHPRMSPYSTPGRSIFSAAQTPLTHTQVSKKSKSKHKRFFSSHMSPLMADARTEHLLLAARKIGRERAHTISGFMRRIEKERGEFMRENLERGRMDKALATRENAYYSNDFVDFSTSPGSSTASLMPRTPKRDTTGGQHTTHFLTPILITPRSDLHQPTDQSPNFSASIRSPAATTPQTSMTPTPRAANHTTSAMSTRVIQTPGANHPTPLASLLSAAKSLMDHESSGPVSNNRRRSVIPEPPESPLSKRRKAGQGNERGSVDMLSATLTPGLDRVRSALDVLADQAAAAFNSDRQSPDRSPAQILTRNQTQEKKKGPRTCPGALSEEEREIESSQKGKVAATGRPLFTRSRTKGISMDHLSKEPVQVLHHRRDDKTVERNAPVPRMIFSPTALSSVPFFSSLSPASPTPHTAASFGGNKVSDDLMPAAIAESTVADSRCTSGTVLRHSASPSPCIDNYGHNQRGLLCTDNEERIRVPRCDAVVSNPISRSTDQAEGKEFAMNGPAMMSKAQTSNSGGRYSHGENKSGHLSESKEGTENLDEGVEVGSRPGRSFVLSEDDHDTDADAEGEMDIDAEETVFMEPQPLA